MLTDSIDKAFDAIFTDVYHGTDATITPKSPFDTGDGSGTSEASFDESLLPTVQDLARGRRRDRRGRERERRCS